MGGNFAGNQLCPADILIVTNTQDIESRRTDIDPVSSPAEILKISKAADDNLKTARLQNQNSKPELQLSGLETVQRHPAKSAKKCALMGS